MQSCARTNGQYQQVGAPTQSSQATHNTMRNLQAGVSNNSCQFWIASTGVQLQQKSATFAYYNRQPSNWQTPAVPGGNLNYLQHSSTNTQSGNCNLSATYGLKQDFHQNSSQSSQSPPNVMNANTTHPQQDMSVHSNHTVLWNWTHRTQGGDSFSNHQQWVDQNGMFHNVNRESAKPPHPYTTTAVSPPHEKAVYIVPTDAHSRRSAQRGFSTSAPLPSYDIAVSESFRNNSVTTNSSLSGQNLHVSSTSHQTRQYSVHKSVGKATTSMNPNSYGSQYETSETNEPPLHPAVTQLDMSRRETIAAIANHLRVSADAVSDGHASPCSSLRQMIEFNQSAKVQPVTSTVGESYNTNASQSLPKTTQSFMSTRHSVDVPPQQTPVTDVLHVKATADGNTAASALSHKNTVGSVSDASQPESISPTRNHTVPNNCEKPDILEMLLSVKTSDGSNNSSPGRTRAVAVVQPLSHKSYQFANKRTSSGTSSVLSEGTAADTALSNPEKLCVSSENQQVVHSAASKGGVSSSTPAVSLTLLKLLCGDTSGSELTVNKQADQRVEQSVPSKVPVSQSSDKDKGKGPTDPKRVLELSAVPTTTWKIGSLKKLIQDVEKSQRDSDITHSTMVHSFNKILCMFWGGKLYNVNYNPNLTWYTDLMTDVVNICKDVAPDTVILSNVKSSFRKQLKNYYTLKHNEVYSEEPYKSTWLNVNEQVDDIDKEWPLKHHLYTFQSDSQPNQVEAEHDTPPQTASAPAELEPVDSSEVNATVETTSTQPASPLEVEKADSGDPYYSFEIHVLPPEEAKIIFAQEESDQPQSMDMEPERPANSSVEMSTVSDDILSDTALENEPVSPLEQFCCIARWKAVILNMASSCKCQCENNQSQEGDDQAKGKENVDSQFMSLGQPELCNHTIDSSEDDDKPHSYSDEEQDISHISINSSQLSVILIDDDDNDLPSNGNEILDQMPNVETDSEVKSTGNVQSCISVSSDKEIEIGQTQLTSTNVAEPSLETEEQPTHATGPLQTAVTGKHDTVERKKTRPSSPALFYPVFNQSKKRKSLADVDPQPVLEDTSKRRKLFVDATDSELSASSARTVELVLFGSKPQDTRVSFGNRNSQISSPQFVSHRAPRVLTVNLSPSRMKSSEAVPTGDYSVKRRIYEKWRRSLPPTKIRKQKTQKCTFASFSGWSPKKAETVFPASTDKLPASSGVKNGNTRLCLSLKRRRSRSNAYFIDSQRGKHNTKQHNGHKQKREKRKKHKDQSADHERSEAENGKHADVLLQNQDVLKFSILPNTFCFKDGSNGREETDDILDKPDTVKGEDKSNDKTALRAKGTWFPNPEKKYCPLEPSAPKTLGLFHEYQKKYTKKTKSSMDK